ncbi:MAG: ABC transporter permease [Rhodospirillaceae bacterium]|nr:ABC transporter permease [Rhodospirillaceae bacterium]
MTAATNVIAPKARLWRSYRRSPLALGASLVAAVFFFGALFAPWLAPQNPFDPVSLQLINSFFPPAWASGGNAIFLLGTDDQGRDMLSAILYGSRISLIVGVAAVAFAVTLGVSLGVLAGYAGGWTEVVLMRIADVQLTIPALLIALMVDGLARATLSPEIHDEIALYMLIFAIGIADWPQYARVVRAATLVQRQSGYVVQAKLIGSSAPSIVFGHVLPNVMTSVLVLATLGLALAIIAEATLSFLGVGMPPTTPSLGTLIRVGNDFLFSGEWWITLFPSLVLVLLALSVNLLGDWLRDALNPRLR